MREKKVVPIIFENVTKYYDDFKAVKDISFKIEPGHLVTLLGPSGCGKTTTLRMIAGLEMLSSGKIFIGDNDVSKVSASNRSVAMVFQSYALFPHMTVLENVGYGLKASGKPKAEVLEAAENGLELVGLKEYGNRYPNALSGGQQQRVAIARSIVIDPDVLLFDEPLSNLDAKLRRRVREDIRELQQRLGLTSVYVTHDQEEALAISDNIIVLKDGVIAQQGSPKELYEFPASAFVADFIGNANVVAANIASINDDTAAVDVGGLQLNLPHRNVSKGEVKVSVHPRAITLLPKGLSATVLEGNVSKSTYLGGHMEYLVDSPLGELFVIDHNVITPIHQGTDVSIDFDVSGASLIPNP
jgi:iron(III) transport system ATP-binding protein